MEKLVFNSSMPRSGSELLQAILHENPRIYASPTSPLLEYQYAARGNYDLPEVKSQEPQAMQRAFVSMCSGMAHSYYAALTDRPVVVDKNRGWTHYYEWVEQWNANPRMICMVRDLRSIVSSMEKVYRKNRHRPTGPDNPAQMQNMTVPQRIEYWLNTQPVGLALQRTFDNFQRGIDKNILYVRYEDLCQKPQDTMNRIYNYIGEPSFAHDYGNIQKRVYEDDSHFGPYGSHRVAPKLEMIKFDHNEVLGREGANSIRANYAWYFEKFGY